LFARCARQDLGRAGSIHSSGQRERLSVVQVGGHGHPIFNGVVTGNVLRLELEFVDRDLFALREVREIIPSDRDTEVALAIDER
jgi:hypothetical protein